VYNRRLDAAENSGPIDRPCTKCSHGEIGVAIDQPVDRSEKQLRNKFDKSTAQLTIQKAKTNSAQLPVDRAVEHTVCSYTL